MATDYPDPQELTQALLEQTRSPSNGLQIASATESEDSEGSIPGEESLKLSAQRPKSVTTKRGSARTRGSTDGPRRGKKGGLGKGHKGVKRGVRNALEPTFEFKALHSEATVAFIDNDYDRAEQLVLRALQVNPEMYEAHNLMAEIHSARGDVDKALVAAWNGAHTRPRDVTVWSKVARLVLQRDTSHKPSTLRDAIYCYARIITVNGRDFEARFQRAALNRELGFAKKAAAEYEQILKLEPHDPTALRLLAEVCIEVDQAEKALNYYQAAIDHAQDSGWGNTVDFGWSDVNIIAELHGFQKDYSAGVIQIKRLSRWLLGRVEEDFWEYYDGEDREWDAEDEPRRNSTPEFEAGQYETTTYGYGLPLELRVKLGIFRLKANPDDNDEAMLHFNWLDPADNQEGAKIYDYPDLFRDVAKALLEAGLHSEAIKFLEPLQQFPDLFDSSCAKDLDTCRAVLRMTQSGEYHTTEYVYPEVDTSASPSTFPTQQARRKTTGVEIDREDSESIVGMLAPKGLQKKRRRAKNPRPRNVMPDLEDLERLHLRKRDLDIVRSQGLPQARQSWLIICRKLIDIFRRQKVFYPSDRQKFVGYYWGAGLHARRLRAGLDNEENSGEQAAINAGDGAEIPNELGGIPFTEWLDILLECAVELARDGRLDEAYDITTAASTANVFYDSPDSMFLIHVCWFTCALMGNDDHVLCNISRWFMKEHQFVTDGYRLFSALNRLSDSDHAWYNASQTQKHLMRQVKSMDMSYNEAIDNRRLRKTKVADGKPGPAEELDVSLLMLYGHVLYTGASYTNAISYFLRAYALDGGNPVIKMSLALGYVHCALKRQAENRHQLLMQGLALMLEYYDIRQANGTDSEKQEAFYNVGRLYHLIGLTHLAVPYYERCLAFQDTIDAHDSDDAVDSFAIEAALALQGIWASNGNFDKAVELTEQWLQI